MQAVGRPARIKIVQPSGVVAMGSFSLMHWIVVLAIILILFGAGKLPRVMGDFAKGIKAFKAGMKEEDEAETAPPAQVPPPATATAPRRGAASPGRRRCGRPSAGARITGCRGFAGRSKLVKTRRRR